MPSGNKNEEMSGCRMLALLEGLKIRKENNVSKVILEGDALTIMEDLIEGKNPPWNLMALWKKVHRPLHLPEN